MATMILCHLDARTAVKLALGNAGHHDVRMPAEVLATLTDEERAELAEYAASTSLSEYDRSRRHHLMLVAEPTVEGVVASLRAEMATKAVAKAKAVAESEERIARTLAAPLADWIGEVDYWRGSKGRVWYSVDGGGYSTSASGYSHGAPRVSDTPRGAYVSDREQGDERIVARRAEVERDALPAAVAAWEAHFAAWREVVAAAEKDAEERHGCEKAAAAKAKVAERVEAEAWVREHGSSRLRKALALGLLADSKGAYLDERLEAERPGGWVWEDKSGEDGILNPDEAELDALENARQIDPEAQLVYVDQETWVTSTFLGRPIARKIGSQRS